jgi:hypothetical protein
VIKEEFDAWQHRNLADIELDYLFLDGTHFRMHPGAPAEPVLAAWGITTHGSPVLLGLAPGADEGTDAWAGFLEALKGRGLRAPLLVITDGAPGLIGTGGAGVPAVAAPALPGPPRRNVLAKSPSTSRLKSRPRSGPSSTTSSTRPAIRRSPRPASAPMTSPAATSTAIRLLCAVCSTRCRS